MKLQPRQQRILWGGFFILLIMLLFPPWIHYSRTDRLQGIVQHPIGYFFVLDTTQGETPEHKSEIIFRLDAMRLVLQTVIVGAITAALALRAATSEASAFRVTRRVPPRLVVALTILAGILIMVFAATYLYWSSLFPADSAYIRAHQSSASIADPQKLKEARTAGYSDAEIAEFLAQRNRASLNHRAAILVTAEATIIGVAILLVIANAFRRTDAMHTRNQHNEA